MWVVVLRNNCLTNRDSCPIGVIVVGRRCPKGVVVLVGSWRRDSYTTRLMVLEG